MWLVALLAWLAAAPALAQRAAPDPGEAVIGPGDVVRIVVWRKPEFTGEFPVAPDGSIAHPLFREVQVAGLTPSAAEERVRAFLARFETNPSFVMVPLFRVVVGGEVRQPNLFTLPPGTTIAQAIASAGGPTEQARLQQVRLVRQGRVMAIDLTRPEAAASQFPIRSGDQIIVGRRSNVLRDVVAPTASVLGVLVGIVNILIK